MNPERPRVLVLHYAPPEGGSEAGVWRESDAAVLVEVAAVQESLVRQGVEHRTAAVACLADVAPLLAAAPEDVVFNLVESFVGAPADANHVPVLCRAFGKGCTGSDTPCLVNALDKGHAKAMLQASGLPVARGAVIPVGEKPRASRLPPGPHIVKPSSADASEGIDAASIVASAGALLDAAVRRVHEEFGQAAIVEQFIDGRELNVSVLERGGAVEVLPIGEIDFSAFPPGLPRIVDYTAKWHADSFEYRNTPVVVPAPLTVRQAEAVIRLVLGAWRALGCRDYARVDFRLDRRGRLFILEVNPNPDISAEAGFAQSLAAAKIPFDAFVQSVVENAWRRAERKRPPPATPAGRGATAGDSSRAAREKRPQAAVRRSEPGDRGAILSLVAATGFFRDDELLVAQEVLDEALAKGPDGHYQSFVADEGGRPTGWVCFGPTPCTVGTFDIYWIAVAPGRQGRGVGRALMRHAEDLIVRRGGRIAVVETSGRAVYDSTRRFYAKLGYHEAARIADFYAPGDAKVVYVKCLQ